MDEKKKCILENELQTLLERLEAGNYEVTATNIPLVMEAVKPHSLDKAHSYLASLSTKVDIEYHPSRGRFGVANT